MIDLILSKSFIFNAGVFIVAAILMSLAAILLDRIMTAEINPLFKIAPAVLAITTFAAAFFVVILLALTAMIWAFQTLYTTYSP